MKTNMGIATSTALSAMPQMRSGRLKNWIVWKTSSATPRKPESEPHAAENEADGEAREQQDRQRREHERRQVVLDVEHALLLPTRSDLLGTFGLFRSLVAEVATVLGRAEQLDELA